MKTSYFHKIVLVGLAILALAACKTSQSYTLKGKLKSCQDLELYFDNRVFLYQNQEKIDSANFIHETFFGYNIRHKKFVFRELTPGQYEVYYSPRFGVDSIRPVFIRDKNVHIKICMDELPEDAFRSSTILDNLQIDDTLYINAYVASAGEFGGYDEGLWIWRNDESFIGQFFALRYSYALSWDREMEEFYKRHQHEAKAKTETFVLNENDMKAIKYFLVETENYNGQFWISNAPEHIVIYDRNGGYKLKYHDHTWSPYVRLKRNILRE